MKKILISGISGFVGCNFMEYVLQHTDWHITGLASWEHKGVPTNISDSKIYQENKNRVDIYTHDLTRPITPDLEVKIGDIDYLVNFASESHVDRSISDPVGFIMNNVSLVVNTLEYARKHKPKVFLQFSTDEVYSDIKNEDVNTLMPANPYAASKAAQDMIARSYWRTYGVPVVITRSNNIVGKSQSNEKFVPKIAELIKRGEEVTIHTTPDGPGKRFYNPVDNVSDALLFILKQEPALYPDAKSPVIYSLPGGTELDNLEMAQLVAKTLGKELKYKLIDANTVRSGYDGYYPKTDKHMKDLGYAPPLTLEEGLKWLM